MKRTLDLCTKKTNPKAHWPNLFLKQELHKLKSAVTDIKFKVEGCAQNSTYQLTLAKTFQNDLNDLKISLAEI